MMCGVLKHSFRVGSSLSWLKNINIRFWVTICFACAKIIKTLTACLFVVLINLLYVTLTFFFGRVARCPTLCVFIRHFYESSHVPQIETLSHIVI